MKLHDLLEEKDKDSKKGSYAGVRFDDDTKKRIKTFVEENEIPNPVPENKLHTTLLYSRKYLPEYEPQGKIDPPYVGEPKDFTVWETQPDKDGDTSNCLILRYDCPDLIERHKKLMDEHDATFDFDEYQPHITLSYNIDDLNPKDLNIEDVGEINAVEEYGEDLDLEWAKNNT